MPVVALFAIGCSQDDGIPEARKFKNAPRSNLETGVLLLGATTPEINTFLKARPDSMVRVINKKHGLFELHFVDRTELPIFFAKAKVYQNVYIKMPGAAVREGQIEISNSFQCTKIVSAQKAIQVQFSHKLDRLELSQLVELGDTVTARIQNPNQAWTYIWQIRAPDDARQRDVLAQGQKIQFHPSVGGDHLVTVVGKDLSGKCVSARFSVFVTANPELSHTARPENSASLKKENFWQVEGLHLEEVWSQSTGKNVTIAIIDTGVNYNHPGLRANIFESSTEIPDNGIDDDLNGFIDDTHGYDFSSSDPYAFDDDGHGTHVAGLAASPIWGVAKNAKILPIKVMTGLGIDIGTFVGAMLYAVDQGAEIINASFGWEFDHPLFKFTIDYAEKFKVTVVAAAGNGDDFGRGQDNDVHPSFPSNYSNSNIVAVAATDELGRLTTYSNFGKNKVHVASFGGRSRMQLKSSAKSNDSGILTKEMYGTSQATPIVAGAIALMIEKIGRQSPVTFRQKLIQSSPAIDSTLSKMQSSGPIDLLALVGGSITRPSS